MTAAAPATLAAQQDPGLFELFAGRKEQSEQPVFGGIALSRFSGAFGLRLSGALNVVDRGAQVQQATGLSFDRGHAGGYGDHHRGGQGGVGGPGSTSGNFSNGSFASPGIGAWNADADLVFEPLRPVPVLRALLLGFSPYAFAGIGGQGIRPTSGRDTSRATMSAGGGVHHALVGNAGLTAEARYRRALSGDSSSYTADLRNRLEYRVGLSFGFGGAHKPRTSRGVPVVPTSVAVAAPAPLPVAPAAVSVSSVLDLAEGLIDTPYRDGGSSPAEGFGAAGFVQYVFGRQGLALPATARGIAREGTAVGLRVGALRPGDLLFFANDGATVDHVAIYMGHDRIIHASASAGRVQSDVLGEGERGQWFADHLVAARRVTTVSAAPRAGAGAGDGAPREGRAP